MDYEKNAIIQDDLAYIVAQDLPWNTLNGSTVIVSGASGCLPAYMVEVLAELNRRGASIRIIGLVRNLHKANARLGHLAKFGVELKSQDITEALPADLPRADYIIHAASQASPRFYGTDPVGTLEANTIGTQHLLRHARASQSRSFLFLSSGEVYGQPVIESYLSENDYGYLDPMLVRSCYAESKRLGETMCVAWAHQYGVPARVVRPFHTYGPGMALDDGRVFADFVADVVEKRNISIKSDGMAKRPFCYVSDATAGFFTILLKGENAQAYNLANVRAEVSVRDLAQIIANLFPERGVKVIYDAPPEGSYYLKSPVPRSCPSIEKLSRLGWAPTVGIAEGFQRTIRSFL